MIHGIYHDIFSQRALYEWEVRPTICHNIFCQPRWTHTPTEKGYKYFWASTSPGLGLGLRPGLPLILGPVSSGFVPASLLSLLHLRMRLLEQLATSRAGDGSAPGQRSTQPAGFRVYTKKKHICISSSLFPATLQPLSGLFWKSLRSLSVSDLQKNNPSFYVENSTKWPTEKNSKAITSFLSFRSWKSQCLSWRQLDFL